MEQTFQLSFFSYGPWKCTQGNFGTRAIKHHANLHPCIQRRYGKRHGAKSVGKEKEENVKKRRDLARSLRFQYSYTSR